MSQRIRVLIDTKVIPRIDRERTRRNYLYNWDGTLYNYGLCTTIVVEELTRGSRRDTKDCYGYLYLENFETRFISIRGVHLDVSKVGIPYGKKDPSWRHGHVFSSLSSGEEGSTIRTRDSPVTLLSSETSRTERKRPCLLTTCSFDFLSPLFSRDHKSRTRTSEMFIYDPSLSIGVGEESQMILVSKTLWIQDCEGPTLDFGIGRWIFTPFYLRTEKRVWTNLMS